MAKKIDHFILFIWVYIIIAIPPFAIIFLLKSLFPESDSIAELANKTPDFSTIVTAAFILPAIGAILSIFRKKIKAVYYWNLEKQEKIHIAIISLLLSIALWQFYSVLYFLNYFGFIILYIFFLLYLPLANIYLSSIDFNKLKCFITSHKKKSKLVIIENILFALVILLILHVSVIVSDGQIRAFNHHLILLSRYPQIKNVKPKIVYYGSKVILLGTGFGWGGEINTKFKNREGNIDITLWNDTKVIFSVPLHWKEGNLDIWIQKPIEWDGKKMVIKSNLVKLRLISRDDGWGKEDDEYFEQLKHLDKETLEINGYDKINNQ